MDDSLIKKALDFASKKHSGQYRKGSLHQQYICHPIAVASNVKNYLKSDKHSNKLIIVALLHDTVEDTDTTLEEISSLFGKDISELVKELTNDKIMKENMGKDKYLAQKMNQMSSDALTVKLCDRLHNIQSCQYVDNNFKKKYIYETLYIFNNLNRNLDCIHLQIITDIVAEIESLNHSKNKVKYYL